MSKTIDEKVVEMRFDNKHFESNVKETMSTLDKFKQKLNLTGASKGLENINTQANKVNMNGMSSAIEGVQSRFSAMEIVGVTALVNIANSAVQAGMRMVKSLTVDPVMDGFREYELMLNSIQTTMAGTGKTAEEVEVELKKLDEYADKTVYSTADMLNNLPKFTNAGVELEKATTAMIGIANATAHAGGDANKASIAFYNLGQAIGTGYLTRMDYNSINNAGIATMEWKEQMVEAALAAGTLTKAGDGLYKAGKKTFTIQQLFIDGLQEQWATTDVMMKVFGDYGDTTTEIGKKAQASAQNIKTFTQMMESLKATAGTGWKDTWQAIFGGLDEATKFWTGLSEFISKIITSIADFRNKVLESALGRGFKALGKTISTITDPMKKAADVAKNVTDSLKDLDTMVTEVIRGNWGNGEDRFQALTKAGYNYYKIQNKVNETLGCSFRYSKDLTEKQTELNTAQNESKEIQTDLTEEQEKNIEMLIKMSDAELRALGYTEEQIDALRELEKYAKLTGLSIGDFIKNLDKINGRWLIVNAFKNAGQALSTIFNSFKEAALFTMGLKDTNELIAKIADNLFRCIMAFHKFSTRLVIGDETAKKLTRTFKGVLAIFDILATVIGGPIKIGLKLLGQLLKALDLIPHDILGITATIGDAIVGFDKWLNSVLDFTAVFEFLAPYLKEGAKAVGDWIKNLGNLKSIQQLIQYLRDCKAAIVDWFNGLKEAEDIPKYIFEGLKNGLANGAKGIIDFFVNFGGEIISAICKVLGIHSPSTEFYEIGTNIMQGLFNGIKGLAKTLYNLVISIGEKLIDIVKNLDLGSIFTIALGGGFIFGLIKIAKAMEILTRPFEGLGNLLFEAGETLQVFQGTLKSFSLKVKAEALKTIAEAIAILAGSVAILALLDTTKVWSSVGAIVVLISFLAALTAIVGKFGGNGLKESLSFGKMALFLIGLAAAMAIMAKALKTISSIDPDRCLQAIGGLIAVVVSLVGMLAIVGHFGGANFTKVGATFAGIAFALLIMASTVRILGKMDPETLKQGTKAVLAFSGIIAGLMIVTKLFGNGWNVDGIGKSIFKIAGALLIMVFVAKIAASMPLGDIIKGTLAIALFGGLIVGLIAATKLVGNSNNVGKIGGAIFGISAALLMMVLVAKIASKMSPEDLTKGIIAIAAFGGIIVGLIAATKLVGDGKNVSKIGRTILMLSISIAMISVVAALLGLMKVSNLAKGVIAVGFISLMMMGLMTAAKNVPQNIMGTLITMTVAIAILATSIGVLSMIDAGRLASASLALGLVLGMFALLVKSTGSAKSAMGTLIVLTVAIGVLAGALYLIAQLPAQQALAGSAALSLLVAALAGVMLVISKMGSMSVKALLGIVGMLALVGMLYLVVDVLRRMGDIQNAAQNATVLAAFMGVLAVVQLLCAATGAIYTATGGMAMLGLLGMVAIIATLYLVIGALALMANIPNAISNLQALQSFMLTMTAVLIALAIVGPLALVGVTAMAALTTLMVIIGVLAVAIGALMEKFPALQSFLDTGLPVLIQLAGGIGEMIGAFVSGIMTQISAGLPEIGTNLSLFMANVMPFIAGAKLVDDQVLKGVAILAGAILALTAAQLLEGITSFLTGGASFAQLGTELSMFMMNAMPFIIMSKQIDPAIMEGVKTLAEAILILTGTNILESMTSWLTGGSSLADFGSQLGTLGTNLKEFVTSLGTFSDDQVKTIDCAGRAIKALAEAADAIPNEGGLWGSLVGENGLSTFGAKLPGLGTHLSQFITNLGTFSDDQVTTVNCAGKAIKALAEAANEIPNEGGLWAKIVGDNSLATFGGHLPGLGTNLKSFVTNLGTFSDEQVTTVNCAGAAIKTLAEAANAIPNEGGLWAKIVGDNGLSKFAGHLPGLGTKLKEFVVNLGTFTGAQVITVFSACEAIRAIATLGTIDIKDTGSKLEKFGENMVKFAKKVKDFVNKVGEVGGDSITSAITKTKDLIEMATTVANTNVGSLNTFGESLKEFAKEGVNGFVKQFSGDSPKSRAKTAVQDMVKAGIKGAEDKKDDVEDKFEDIADAAVDAMCTKSLKDSASQAGKDLVTGFANGITTQSSIDKVTAAGTAIGKAALKAAKEALDSNSPSKEAMKLGNDFDDGLVIGIDAFRSKVYNAGYNVAEYAKNGLSKAISKVSDLMMNGIDSQPTIRPVLDLSEVESGVGTLGSMFNGGPSIGVASNLRAISFGMNDRNSNGANDDVVSAINKLSKNLGNVKGDTYNVNGVTYDDGSNITEAVKTLVRTVKIERRV